MNQLKIVDLDFVTNECFGENKVKGGAYAPYVSVAVAADVDAAAKVSANAYFTPYGSVATYSAASATAAATASAVSIGKKASAYVDVKVKV